MYYKVLKTIHCSPKHKRNYNKVRLVEIIKIGWNYKNTFILKNNYLY